MVGLFAAGDGIDPSIFAQYGVLGVIAGLLIWFAKSAHQRERDKVDKLEAENRALHELILERVFPALTAASTAAQEVAALLRELQRERELDRLSTDQRRRTKSGDV